MDIVLEYEDSKEGVSFTLHPPPDRALDAFYYPNAYAWLECGQGTAKRLPGGCATAAWRRAVGVPDSQVP
jgi:hypothetical protein